MVNGIVKSFIAVLAVILPAMTATLAKPAAPGHDPLYEMFEGLIDQNGRPINVDRFAGRFVLVNFIFTGCGTSCPTQTAELARFHKALPPSLRSRVTVLSISVDPGNDKPARLKAFARAHGADPKLWTFATGRPDRIMRVVRKFVALRPQDNSSALHTTEVRLFDTRHRMIQRYSGVPLAARQIRADIDALVELARR